MSAQTFSAAVRRAFGDALDASRARLAANGIEGQVKVRIEVVRRGDSAMHEGSCEIEYSRCARCGRLHE